ncbi:uncharacterized protein G2W53_032029 [Senna tora]|uniref:Uncharacterized protein n=1 Tax=Senna tora TaxID=362788 RepID=A0A834W7B3_9FABA|nr:uncharacterized protein G2W53_032029 [Senna tora]
MGRSKGRKDEEGEHAPRNVTAECPIQKGI